jgi:hypothetical protein
LQSVGGPYLLLSSNAPMLQRWAANTSHPLARNPYPLYAASNAGSLLGLLAFPMLMEPLFTTTQQFGILTAGFLFLILGFVLCVVLTQRFERTLAPAAPAVQNARSERATMVRWLAYSAIPASLLFGTTTFIITDIASVPLLWIIPLMLYISSFIIAFSERAWKMRMLAGLYFPLGLLTLICAVSVSLASHLGITPIIAVLLTLITLFVGTFLFHRRLYELRPKADDSGLFYVILALGGALGGCFNSFVAPQIFRTAAEFPLIIAISLLVVLLPDFQSANVLRQKGFPKTIAILLLLMLLGARAYMVSNVDPLQGVYLVITGVIFTAVLMAALMLSDWFYQSARRGLLAILVVGLLGGYLAAGSGGSWLYAERNFFGISRVRDDNEHAQRLYSHGVTLHGIQSTQEQYRLKPTSYYGPLGDIFANLPSSVTGWPVGVLGLGVGTIACYAKPGQEMDFYEIDPASIHIATDPAYFTYMRDCAGKRSIIVGDGRIAITEATDGRYGFIIMDAFTSDAIPMHLLTHEALTMYGRKLQPNGLLAFNISNRYIDLLPVFRTLSMSLGWTGRYRFDIADKDSLAVSSLWVVLGKQDKDLEPLDHLHGWKPLPADEGEQYRWTDNYTNLLSVLRSSTNWTSAL